MMNIRSRQRLSKALLLFFTSPTHLKKAKKIKEERIIVVQTNKGLMRILLKAKQMEANKESVKQRNETMPSKGVF